MDGLEINQHSRGNHSLPVGLPGKAGFCGERVETILDLMSC